MTTLVLVVEDDPHQREQLAGFLRSLDLTVEEAESAEAARARLDEGGLDIVVTDLRLPGEDGVSLLRWARARHPLVGFLVVTAHGSVEAAVEAMRHGAHDFLTKPIDLDVLEQRLRRLRERTRLEREIHVLRERLRVAVQRVIAHARVVVAARAGEQRERGRVLRGDRGDPTGGEALERRAIALAARGDEQQRQRDAGHDSRTAPAFPP